MTRVSLEHRPAHSTQENAIELRMVALVNPSPYVAQEHRAKAAEGCVWRARGSCAASVAGARDSTAASVAGAAGQCAGAARRARRERPGSARELRGERGGSGRGLVRCGHEGPEPSAGRHLRVPQREVVEPIPGSLSPHARQGLAAAARRQASVLPQRVLDGESCEMYSCMQR